MAVDRIENLQGYNPILSEAALAYLNSAFIGTELLPIVSTKSKKFKYRVWHKDKFKWYETERALRAEDNKVMPGDFSYVEAELDEHSISEILDYNEIDAALDFDLKEDAVETVMGIIELSKEKKIADLVQTAGNFTNKVALTTTGCWSDTTNSDPEANITTGKDAIFAAVGQFPTVAAMGIDTWSLVKAHPKLKNLIFGTNNWGVITEELFAKQFGFQKVVIGAGWYDLAGTVTKLWNDNFIMAWVPVLGGGETQKRGRPSFGYTFSRENFPVVDERNPDNDPKLTAVRCTQQFLSKLTLETAGYLISNTQA